MLAQLTKALIFIGFCVLLNVEAFAQNQRNGITLEFNRSPAQAVSLLEQRGYTEVKVLKRQLLALDIEACKEGVRQQFKLRLDGQIYDQRQIGRCGNVITEAAVRRIAQENGFTDISIVEIGRGFQVTGCRASRDRREQFFVSLAGRITNNRIVGSCETRVSFEAIKKDLERFGFDRIELEQDQRLGYIILACRDRRQYQLQVANNGRVESERVVGRCRDEMNVAEIVPMLEKLGYERVVVTDKDLPRYKAEACKEGLRYEIVLTRYGQIRSDQNIGRCRPSMDNDRLKNVLVTEGFYNIAITNGRRARFLATACYANRQYEIDYTRYGELVGERDAGECRPMNAVELMETAVARGAKNAVAQVRACRDGQEIVYQLDRDGIVAERAERGNRC